MVIVSNNENLTPYATGLFTTTLSDFKGAMDALLIDGPSITLDLRPQKTQCLSNCRFNPTYNKYMGTNGGICRTCKGTGFTYEHRQTIYKCNRRWTNEPFDDELRNARQKTPAGMVFGNFVRVKTVIQSFDHIQGSLGATIDGVKVKLFEEPRQTGWGSRRLYVVSWWERANKKVSNA